MKSAYFWVMLAALHLLLEVVVFLQAHVTKARTEAVASPRKLLSVDLRTSQ